MIYNWKKALGTKNSTSLFSTLSGGEVLTGFLEHHYHWELRRGSLSKLDCDKLLDESSFLKNTFLFRSFQYLRSIVLISSSFLLRNRKLAEKDSLSSLESYWINLCSISAQDSYSVRLLPSTPSTFESL